ncbi:MAG: HD domain-containing protein [Clostridiales bacterium]|nr:HD domain-containing protein [Clostridiales bacterium]
MQHGETSVYAHSLAVAKYSLLFARFLEKTFKMKLDKDSIVRGALLHDYFLYDWHEMGEGKITHGLTHPRKAMNNADRDFGLNDLEKDIILKHMFPITPVPPKHRESFIVDIADTWCAICEALKIDISSFVIRRVNFHIALANGRFTLGENVTNLVSLVKPEFAAEA